MPNQRCDKECHGNSVELLVTEVARGLLGTYPELPGKTFRLVLVEDASGGAGSPPVAVDNQPPGQAARIRNWTLLA